MKRRTWIAVGVTVALLAAAMLMPVMLAHQKDVSLLAEARVTESTICEFALEDQRTLTERMQVLVGNFENVFLLAPERLEARYGTAEEIQAQCLQELETLFPHWDWSNIMPISMNDWIYCGMDNDETMVVGQCYFCWGWDELVSADLVVWLDLESGLVFRLETRDSILLDLILSETEGGDFWAEDWSSYWAAYLGLQLLDEMQLDLEHGEDEGEETYLRAGPYADPTAPSAQISYELIHFGDRYSWEPYLPEA